MRTQKRSHNRYFSSFQILPGLQSFCVTCAVCIGSIYLLQASWFVAWFALDQRRVAAGRDGLFPCCVKRKKNWGKEKEKKKEDLGKRAMAGLAKALRQRVMQVGLVEKITTRMVAKSEVVRICTTSLVF